MTDTIDAVTTLTERAEVRRDLHAATPGKQTTEFLVVVAQLAFAGFALYHGYKDVAMVALAASGLYPVSRAVVKR